MAKESLLNEPQDPAKNSVGVIYAGLVITLIFTIVGFSSYALEQHGIAQIQELDRLDFEKVIEGDYIPKSTSCQWFGNKLVCQNEKSDYTVKNYENGESSEEEILLPYKTIKTIGQCWRCTV